MNCKKFVIHIKGCSRYNQMVTEMDKFYKNEYKIFDAIVKPNPKEGISESFKYIIRENYNEPYIHIFEDDVKFPSKKSRVIFEENFKSIPGDWDIYLGGSYTFAEEKHLGNLLKINNFRSLHSVVIRKSAYDSFLSHKLIDHKKDIDTWVANEKLNVYLCNPMVAVQYSGYSFNARKNVDYENYLKDKNICV